MESIARFTSAVGAMNLPWVDSPFFPQLLERANLGDAEQRMLMNFARDGYLVIDPEIPDSLIESIVRGLRDRYRPTYDPYFADETRVQDAWQFNEDVRVAAAAPRVLEVLRLLYQREPYPFQTLNFRVGSQQRTHSDTIHFSSMPQGFMCGVWLALEDIDRNNGPLHYYPTSHKLPVYDMADIGISASFQRSQYENYPKYEDFVEALMKSEQLERHEIDVKRGQALIWSSNLFHGGSPILDSSRTRFSQVTHYYFDGCLYYTPLLSDRGLGKLFTQRSVNVQTGDTISQYYNGTLVENPGEWPPRLVGQNLLAPKALVGPEPSGKTHRRFLDWLARPDAAREVIGNR